MRSLAWIAASAMVFGLVVAASETQAQSVGFFPATIDLENALRGQDYQTRTTLVNQDDETRVFTIAASGDTAPWTTFTRAETPDESVDQVEVPPETEVELLVTVDVPDTAPNGKTSGAITYEGYTAATFESREGLVTGFEQPVRVNVTGDQVLDLRVGDVSARDVEVGDPLQIKAALSNQGNVDTASELSVDIFSMAENATEEPLDSASFELEAVPPGQSRNAIAEWQTDGYEVGRYRADYALALDGERLGIGSFEFELKPPGSIVPEGAIVSVNLIEPIAPGAVNRADVTFENTGDREVQAHFSGHLYKEAAALSEAETPDSLTVAPGESVVLSAYFDMPAADGDYELRGRAFFEGEQTDEVSLPFAVGGDGATMSNWMAAGGGALVGVGVLAVSAAWLMKRRA